MSHDTPLPRTHPVTQTKIDPVTLPMTNDQMTNDPMTNDPVTHDPVTHDPPVTRDHAKVAPDPVTPRDASSAKMGPTTPPKTISGVYMPPRFVSVADARDTLLMQWESTNSLHYTDVNQWSNSENRRTVDPYTLYDYYADQNRAGLFKINLDTLHTQVRPRL